MMSYLWVTIGSALGGLLRYTLTRLTLTLSASFPYGTILINVLGCLAIGYVAGLTLHGRALPDNLRLFLMVGICGGFTTFSAFSLQTFDLLRNGAWVRALANATVSVVLCLAAVAAGHLLAQQVVARAAVAAIAEPEATR